MTLKTMRNLETILLEYVERFGATPAAMRYFNAAAADESGDTDGGLSESEKSVSMRRFGYLP